MATPEGGVATLARASDTRVCVVRPRTTGDHPVDTISRLSRRIGAKKYAILSGLLDRSRIRASSQGHGNP
jgi:hypothetical protein